MNRPGLVERVNLHFHLGVLAENLLRVFVSVERVHQYEGNVRVVRLV